MGKGSSTSEESCELILEATMNRALNLANALNNREPDISDNADPCQVRASVVSLASALCRKVTDR
jgi:hypothetical protein